MSLLRRLSLYTGVGAVGTISGFAVLVLFVEVAQFSPVLSSSAGALVGALINYVLNYRITFQSDKQHREALPKYFTITAIGFFLNGAIMFIGTEFLIINYLIMQCIASAVVLFTGFMGNQFWASTTHSG